MNIITCNENCQYQKDGYCKLYGKAVVNVTQVNGCSYYKKRQSKKANNVIQY